MYGHQQGLKPPEDRMVKLCRNDSPYIHNSPLHKQHNNTHHPSPAQTCSQISWAESPSFASQGHASGAFVVSSDLDLNSTTSGYRRRHRHTHSMLNISSSMLNISHSAPRDVLSAAPDSYIHDSCSPSPILSNFCNKTTNADDLTPPTTPISQMSLVYDVRPQTAPLILMSGSNFPTSPPSLCHSPGEHMLHMSFKDTSLDNAMLVGLLSNKRASICICLMLVY